MYQGKPWDMDAVRELGMKLTVDKNGNDATSADFDPANVVQWGFDMQYADNSPLAETVAVRRQLVRRRRRQDRPDPGPRRDRREVVQRRRLEGSLHPERQPDQQRPARQGQRVRVGQPRDERDRTAGSRCCVNPAAPAKPKVKNFGFAIAPSYNGKITAKLHADTFSMLKTTKVPDAAFKALTALVGSAELLTIYGAFPADPSQAGRLLQGDRRELPGRQARLVRSAGDARLPGHPQPPVLRPELRQGQGRLAGLPEQVPDHRRASTSTRSWPTLKTTLQGIFDEPAP